MKIAYVGNFTQTHCTEVHLAKTLEMLGHEVVRLQEDDLKPDWTILVPEDTDMFLYTRTWGKYVTLEDLQILKNRHIPTVSYHLDLYIGLARKYLHGNNDINTVLQTDAFWQCDYVFSPDGDPQSQEVFKRNGVHHYYMKPGVFEPECYMAEPVLKEEEKLDVLFVGGGDRVGSPHIYGHPEWNYRNELITWLYDTYNEKFTKFGHPQRTIRNEELNQLYADTKVTVGDSVCLRSYTQTYYWSDRVYETIGRGGFLIHPYIKGLEEEFTDDETIVFYEYGNWDQLKAKIDFYLANDILREKIRKAGQKFVKENCTYTHRMKAMLDVVFKHSQKDVEPIKINLGCGSEPNLEAGWVNVDILPLDKVDVIHDLNKYPYPFEDESADEIKAIDVIEHLDDPMKFVKECHRILRHGGKLFMTTPHWQSKNLWIDPSHKRGYDEQSMDYFDPDTDFGKWYGYYSPDRKFHVKSFRTENDNVEFTLTKI
jgi:SAM-dependent methyltransferase